MAEIQRCPKSPASAYCQCYDAAARRSLERRPAERDPFALPDYRTGYPTMSPGDSPPLNVPSRANQKQNTFSKVFDPQKRKIIVLLIAGVLLFIALVSYD